MLKKNSRTCWGLSTMPNLENDLFLKIADLIEENQDLKDEIRLQNEKIELLKNTVCKLKNEA